MTLYANGVLTPQLACSTQVYQSTLCEYTLLGSYDTSVDEFACCPYGVTPVMVVTCPAPVS